VKRVLQSAAFATALLAAPAADAQRQSASDAPASFGPSFLPSPSDALRPALSAQDLLQRKSGMGISSRTFTEEDGSTIVRRGLIGNWAISSGLEAGVGLFSVSGGGRKQNETRRNWSVMDVTPKNENIAAVGMKLRF
jgi:hypothetical protein